MRIAVKTRFERLPGVTKRELVISKKSRGKPVVVKAKKNTLREASFSSVAELVKAFPRSKFFIHQHLPHGKRPGRALVSLTDIERLSDLMKAGKADTGVIVTFDAKGNVVGYTVYKLSKPLSHLDFLQIEMELGIDVRDGKFSKRNPDPYNQLITKYFSWCGAKYRQRFFAIPGYMFNKNKGLFEKI